MEFEIYDKEPKRGTDATTELLKGDGRSPDACTVMLWSQFIESPWLLHPAFNKGYRPGQNYPGILDITRGRENEWMTMFEAFSIHEFLRISQKLQSQCLLFRTYVEHERVTRISEKHYRTERWTDELAVLINTDSPEIRDKLHSILEKVKTDIQIGRKNCLRLDFGLGLKNWYGRVCEGYRNGYGISGECDYNTDKVENICVFVLNCSKPVSFFMSKWTIIGCFLCWLITGGCCYHIHRKKTVNDSVEKFNYHVTFEGRGANEQEDTPCCGCGKIYHLPVWNLQQLQMRSELKNEERHDFETRRGGPLREDEQKAILDHLQEYIVRKEMPRKKEIDVCIETEPALQGRHWRCIRDFLFDQIV